MIKQAFVRIYLFSLYHLDGLPDNRLDESRARLLFVRFQINQFCKRSVWTWGVFAIAKELQNSDSEIKIGFVTEKNLAKNLSDLKILRLNLNNLTKRKK